MSTSPSLTTPTPLRRWMARGICALVLLGAVAAVVAVFMMAPRQTEEAEAPDQSVNVETWTVTPVPEMADTFDLTAVVEPEMVVEVAAEVAGRLERWAEREQALVWRGREIPAGAMLDEGHPIKAGDPIAHLNRDLLAAQYASKEAQYEYDLREYERILGLHRNGNTSKKELDDALTRRDISKASMDEIARQLERTTIVAPITGVVNRLPMELGEYASPGMPVAEIVRTDPVKIAVDIPERDVFYLEVGQRAEIAVMAPQERTLTGELTYLSSVADARTRTTRLEITVDNPDHLLRSGQIVKVRLTRRVLEDVLMIPLGAVIPLEQGRVVYVVDGENLAQPRRVELGFIKGREVRVLNGLAAGDTLIVSGHRYVGPGQAVEIANTPTDGR